MEQRQVSLFIEENLKTIYAYALSRVSNKEDAADLAEDIILAILQSASRLRDDHAFFGYIWAIAANTYKKYLRKKNAHSHTKLDQDIASYDMDVVSELIKNDEMNMLRRELAILAKEYRECTVAYYMEGLSCADTAKKLHISLDMVKYYLFKTRKILKEGISMEREFGEKSYKPSIFHFVTIFSGQFNREYRNLFKRKLPGNILVSAYYTPMTVRELAIELGVASVYLEDEIELLVEYGLLTVLSKGKYQTNLVIFTEDYTNEFIRAAENKYLSKLTDILQGVKSKLPEIRRIGFTGSNYDDNHLVWAFLFDLMREGNIIFEESHPKSERKSKIYDGATGINYGIDYNEECGEYTCRAFAGYAGIDDKRFAIFADFGILPETNHYSKTADFSTAPVLTKEQKEQMEAILSEEINQFAELYFCLSNLGTQIMAVHAPKSVGNMVEEVIAQTIFFRTVGIIGALAVHSGELSVPEKESVKPVLVCDFSEQIADSDIVSNVMDSN